MLAHLSPNGESVTERPNDERHALLRRLVHPSDTTLVAETRTVETAEELMTVFDAAIGARLEGIVAMAPLDELRRWDGAGLPPAPPGGLRREVLQGVARVMEFTDRRAQKRHCVGHADGSPLSPLGGGHAGTQVPHSGSRMLRYRSHDTASSTSGRPASTGAHQ